MGVEQAAWESALPISLGYFTTAAHVDQAVQRICNVVKNLEKRS